ncbi:MAG: hypothetical protein RI554_11005, partial [Trueperaceae bacterium]|nr:hypothetical protein [Trueperaceae bacterium]
MTPGPPDATRDLDVALVPIDCGLGDVPHDLPRIHRAIGASRDAGDLVVFPERAPTGDGIGSRFAARPPVGRCGTLDAVARPAPEEAPCPRRPCCRPTCV